MIITLDGYRAVVYDKHEGIVVLDVTASNEAEAMGRARTAAETHLKCKAVTNVIVRKHTDMPAEWLRQEPAKALRHTNN